MPSEPVSQWARLTGDDVMRRNRYANVEPFDGNRIRLKVPEGHSDYINASPIVLNSTRTGTPKNFIATQVRPRSCTLSLRGSANNTGVRRAPRKPPTATSGA